MSTRHDSSSSRSRASRALLAAAWIVAIALPGCATRSAVLARVGRRVITVDDFNLAARANWTQYPGNPEVARARLLDDLVRRALLLSLADARGLAPDSSVARYRRTIEEQILSGALGDQLMPRNIPVSDAEVATFYDWSHIRARVQLIYATSRPAADAAAARLRAGRPFAEVASQFTAPGLLPPGGELGEISAGSLVDPLDTFVREAPIGRIEGPVEAPGEGWFIVRITSRHRGPAGPSLETQRRLFADLLRQRKQRLISVRAFEGLRDQYHAVVEPDGAQTLYALLNRPVPPESALIQHARAPGDDVTPEGRRRIVARYTDAAGKPLTYSLGEALEDLRVPDRQRPSPTELPAIAAWLEQQVIRRVVLLEARRRGLDRDPTIARSIDERVNNAILESIYGLAISDIAASSESDARALYAQRSTQYQRLDAARLLHVTFTDSAAVTALLRHGGHAGTLRDAVKMAGLPEPVVEERITFPSTDPIWGPIQPNLQSMSKGEWAGPMRTRDGWMVLQLLDKEESAQDFDQLSPAIRQGLEQEALSLKREQRLVAVTDSLRRDTHPFEIRDDVLKRIPWPPVAALN